MSDQRVKCAKRKCGWIGLESEMIQVRVSSFVTKGHCPRCNGQEFYYKLKPNEMEKAKTGAELIALERDRQIKIEKFNADRDDGYTLGELGQAAESYLAAVTTPDEEGDENGKSRPAWDWPWDNDWWKPSPDPIRNLVKAGALIAAEIDRLQRLAAKEAK